VVCQIKKLGIVKMQPSKNSRFPNEIIYDIDLIVPVGTGKLSCVGVKSYKIKICWLIYQNKVEQDAIIME
jgi:hypothetical protein